MIFALIFIGLLFKIMHWKGGEMMLNAGLILLFFATILILIVFLATRNKKSAIIPGKNKV